jgi:malonate-semialdehyde dehydrogenase (acetylating)/methylmalonate-semialdehyde dehydrogenase
MQTLTHWIDGKPYHADGARHGDIYNPATGEVAAQVPFATAEDVDRAVSAAREAFLSWRSQSLSRRTRILFAFRHLLEAHTEDLVRVVSREHGKVLDDARGEVARGREVVEYACGIPTLLKSEFNENVSTMVDSYGIRQPLGVCVGITPFNFPVMVPMWMYPLAIACGNTFVLKPSEKDPSASLLQAELFSQAGLPEGVFNVVHGDREAVDALLTHPDVKAVSFVGSTPIARHIYETSTRQGKRVQALGGAKNHALVLPDASMDFVADQITSAAYGSAGERCMAISTVVAVGDAADPLVEKLRQRAEALSVGDGLEPDSQMGPLVTREHRDRVAGYVDAGVEEGATLVVDGRGLRVQGREDGFFLGPCLFDNVTTDMSIYKDEIFGPVLVVLRVGNYDEGIELINRNPYGNGTAIFTNDGGAARMFQHEVQAGMVGVNVPIPVPMAYHSFGGWKDSLFGDLHIHGPEGIRFYTRGKLLTTRWPDPHERGIDLGFPVSQ